MRVHEYNAVLHRKWLPFRLEMKQDTSLVACRLELLTFSKGSLGYVSFQHVWLPDNGQCPGC